MEQDYLPRVPGLRGETGPPGAHPQSCTGAHPHPHAHSGPSTDSPSLVELMRMTREEWDLWTRGSAIRRAGYAGFKRNVAVAMGNWGSEEAVAVLIEALHEDEPLVRGHAGWALGRIGGRAARDGLVAALGAEQDDQIREELERASAETNRR